MHKFWIFIIIMIWTHFNQRSKYYVIYRLKCAKLFILLVDIKPMFQK